MNAYVKQMIESKIEFLEREEQEVEINIDHIKKQLSKQEEKLIKIREEKEALQQEQK